MNSLQSLLVTSTLSALSLCPSANQTPPEPRFEGGQVAFFTQVSAADGQAKISVEGSYGMAQRAIHYRYSYPHGADTLKGEQSFAVDYWPTACNKGKNLTSYVVGKGHSNNSFVAEVWRFEMPSLSPGGWTAEGVLVPPEIRPGRRRSVLRVHDAEVPGGIPKEVVQQMGSQPEAVLVYFDRSREIFSLSLDSGALTLIASPSSSPGVLNQPALLEDWAYFYVREHQTDGFVYIAHKGSDVASETGRVLLFHDRDKDGRLDETQVVSVDAWRALGYQDPRAWRGDW